MNFILLSCMAAVVTARPSYIAVPADQIAFLDLSRVHVRVPRQTLSPPPPSQHPQALYDDDDYQPLQQQYQGITAGIPLQPYQQAIGLSPPPEPLTPGRVITLQQQPQQVAIASAPAKLQERPPDFGEYVDFGAHTGDHGAFGWYADYPINNHEDSSYRK